MPMDLIVSFTIFDCIRKFSCYTLIMKILHHHRKDYMSRSLSSSSVPADPFLLFNEWLQFAIDTNLPEPTAMSLATADASGKPSCRIVLLKEVTERGVRFFTNYQSRKGQDLLANPNAAVTLFWPQLERQVRMEGLVEKVSEKDSDLYFLSRPHDSNLGAWASPQSRTVPARSYLEQRLEQQRIRFQTEPMSRPAFWGGYELIPVSVEFWQGRSGRLHDRILYTHDHESWGIERLAP
jgi:pyridoxamine 5'-phosphate oxidase